MATLSSKILLFTIWLFALLQLSYASHCSGSNGRYCFPFQRWCDNRELVQSEKLALANNTDENESLEREEVIFKCCPYIRGVCCIENMDFCWPEGKVCEASTKRCASPATADSPNAVHRFLSEIQDPPMLRMQTATIFGPY